MAAAITVAVGALAVVLTGGAGSTSAASVASASGLQISVTGSVADPELVLTNGSSAPCQIPGSASGAVQYTTVEQDGKPVTPTTGTSWFPDSVPKYLNTTLRTLAAGESVRIDLPSTVPAPLSAISSTSASAQNPSLISEAWSDTNDSLVSLYQLNPVATARIALTYAPPLITSGSIPLCERAPDAGPVTGILSAAQAAGAGTTGLAGISTLTWILIAAVAVVVVALVIFLLLRKRKRRAQTSAAGRALIILALSSATLIHATQAAPHAAASIGVPSNLASVWSQCDAIFNQPGGDPENILPTLEDPRVTVILQEIRGQSHESQLNDGTIIIYLDPTDTHAFTGGGNATPCTNLYHELFHAYQDIFHKQNHNECYVPGPGGNLVPTGLTINEVAATIAENKLRAHLGLTQRTYYGYIKLPTVPCQNPPTPLPRPVPTGCDGHCGNSTGDPHLTTYDGRRYDFQGAGEFIETQDPAGGFTVQVRQQPYPGSDTVSVTTATAMDVAGDHVEVDPGPQGLILIVNGVTQASTSQSLPHGGTVATAPGVDGETATITWPDGSVAEVAQIGGLALTVTVLPAAAHAGRLVGLFGNDNGNPADDVRPNGGQPIANATFTALYPGFADSWRITAAQSLFTYAAGQSTATYTDRSFPNADAASEPVADPTLAEQVCSADGVTDPVSVQDCRLDVGLTGQPDFADADLIAQSPGTGTGSGAGQPTATAQPGGTLTVGGAPVLAEITKAGTPITLPFAGTTGEKVFINVPSTTLPDGCDALELLAPGGSTLTTGCLNSGNGFIDGTVLPSTGQYSVLIKPAATATGTATVQAIADHDQTGTIAEDGPTVTATVAQPGATATFSFTAVPGTTVFVNVPSATLPDDCGVVQLIAPNGQSLLGGCTTGGNGFIAATELKASGTYAVLVDPKNRDTCSATIQLIVDRDQTDTIAVGGPAVTADIAQYGAVSSFTFQGSAGQKVALRASGSTLPDQCDQVAVADASGNELGSICVSGRSGTGSAITLPASGQYSVLVHANARATGHISVRLVSS